MTTPGYRTAPAALHDAADGIDDLIGELRRLTTAGRAGVGLGVDRIAPDPDRVGHDELAAELRTFCARWTWGVQALARSGTEMADGLRASIRAYEHTEGEVGSVFSRLLADVAGDPRADPERASRASAGEILAGLRPDADPAAARRRAVESIAETWEGVGADVVATTRDRVARSAAGTDPFAPDVEELGELGD